MTTTRTTEERIARAVKRAMLVHGAPKLVNEPLQCPFYAANDISLDFGEVRGLLTWLQRYLRRLDKVARYRAIEEDADVNEVLGEMQRFVLATLLDVEADALQEEMSGYGIVLYKDGNSFRLDAYNYCIFGASRAYHPLEKIGLPFTEPRLVFEYVPTDYELFTNEFLNQKSSIHSFTITLSDGNARRVKFKFKKQDAAFMERLIQDLTVALEDEGIETALYFLDMAIALL